MAWLAIAAMAITLSGCLASSYRVPPHEIDRVSKLSPELRGRRLRVVQRMINAPVPRLALGWSAPTPATPEQARTLAPSTGAAPLPYPYPDYYFHLGHPHYGPVGLRAGRGPGAAVAEPPRAPLAPGPTRAGGSPAGRAPSNTNVKAMLVGAAVLGVGLGIGLAATEGARYDGWVAVHPEHPVHLMGWDGSERIVPLSRLSPETLRRGEEAVIRRDQGVGLWELGRAPLSRRGLCYGFGVGSRSLPVAGYGVVGTTAGQLELGYFPSQHFGLLASIALGWGSSEGGGLATVVLPAVELQLLPVALWRLHFGVYGQLGRAWSTTDGGDLPSTDLSLPSAGVGGLMQWDLLTRLALTFRWGTSWRMGAGSEPLAEQLAIGLTVY